GGDRDASGQNPLTMYGIRPGEPPGKRQIRNDSSASAQANGTNLVRGLARIGIDSRKSKLVRNCVMHRNKYLTFLHRIGYDGGCRYLPATRCYKDFFIGRNSQV